MENAGQVTLNHHIRKRSELAKQRQSQIHYSTPPHPSALERLQVQITQRLDMLGSKRDRERGDYPDLSVEEIPTPQKETPRRSSIRFPATGPLNNLLDKPRGRDCVRMLGDYSFCLAVSKVMQCRQTQDAGTDYTQSSGVPLFTASALTLHPSQTGTRNDSDDGTQVTDQNSSRKLDAAFLILIHALTKFSRYIVCVRFGNGLRAVPSAEIFQNDKDMHIDSLLQDLSQRFGSPSESPQGQYPCFPKYQDDMISDIVTRWGGFSRELAYTVFVVQGVGVDLKWNREVQQVYLKQVQSMALANQPLEQVMDIFWPRDECWAALEGRGPETTVLSTTASLNLASKERTEGLKTMLDYFTTLTPTSPPPHELPSYLHVILDSLYTPIETHPERYMRVLRKPESLDEEFPRVERYLNKVTKSAEILGGYWKMLDRKEREKVLGMFE